MLCVCFCVCSDRVYVDAWLIRKLIVWTWLVQHEKIPQKAATTGLVEGGEHEPGGLRAEILQRGERR